MAMQAVHIGHHQQLHFQHMQHVAARQGARFRRSSVPAPAEAQKQAMIQYQQQQQVLLQRRPPLQVRRHGQFEENDDSQDRGPLPPVPQPLPSQWRAEFELCPGNLGKGAFAEVFRVQHKRTQQNFAVKVMHRPNFAMRGIECQISAEIEAMAKAARSRKLQEDLYILQLLDSTNEGEFVYLLLELCEQGDLLSKLANEPSQRLPEQEVAVIARQLMIGLQRVHELGYIHRDIKPDNLLADAEGRLRIADFGWCCLREDHPSCLAGTLLYMAPEVLRNEPQDVDADVWSAGMTLYQMLVGRPLLQVNLSPGATRLSERDPHQATEIKQKWLLQEICSVCPPSPETKPSNISEECWDFLGRVLTVQREYRINITEALQHPWLQYAERVQEENEAAAARRAQELCAEMPQSPPRARPKVACKAGRSPGQDVSVPTPEKPRSYDPTRNNAWSPPVSPAAQVSPELTPERTRFGQENSPDFPAEKENNADPEVSPERKTKLQNLQKLTAKWNSPKDDLTEKMEKPDKMQAKAMISQLASPLRCENSRPNRKTIASAAPAGCGEVKRVTPILEGRQYRRSQMLPKQMKEMSNGLSKVYEDLPEVEEGREIGQTHFSSVKMAVFADKGLSCDPLGASAPHHKGYVQRFPGDTRIALRGAPPADNVKGELLTPRTAERPQIQGAPQVTGGGIAGARSAKVFHSAVCLSPQQRYQQASPVRSRQHVQQRGPMMTASAPCVSHMKPGVVPQVFHQRVAPVYAPHARAPHAAPHAPHPHPAAPCGKQVFVARMPEAFGKSNMMRPCAGGPNRK